MGRAKMSMELITKEKSRNITFKKRKESLIRKMHEFTTLCDVSACMIIYGPKQENGSPKPEIWPQNLDEVRRIIDIYKAKNKDSGNKTFTLANFFHDRKRKIEEELATLKKKNMEAKYPAWPEFLNFMPEAHLRELAAMLSNKADYVKSRIQFLRRNKESGLDITLMDFTHAEYKQSHHGAYYPPPAIRGMELETISQQAISSVEQNSMMMWYYAPSVLPQPYMPVGLEAPFSTREFHESGQKDNNIVLYEMMNERARFFD